MRLRLGRWPAAALMMALAFAPGAARAEGSEVVLDGTAVRFYAPETGGARRPQFISHRVLAFQAAVEAKAEDRENVGVQDRHVRAAVDRLVVEGVLAALPLERTPDARELASVMAVLRAGLSARVGGDDVLVAAAAAQGLSPEELDQVFARRARAALYADRLLRPILYPSEEQLREVFRTAPHPYRGQRFEDVKSFLAAWYVDERLRGALTAFLQSARARIRVVPIGR